MFQSSIAPKDDRNLRANPEACLQVIVPILDRPEGRPQLGEERVLFIDLGFQSSIAPKDDRNSVHYKPLLGKVSREIVRESEKLTMTSVTFLRSKNAQTYTSYRIANLPEKIPPLVVRVRESEVHQNRHTYQLQKTQQISL
jgi:hypothetical protein